MRLDQALDTVSQAQMLRLKQAHAMLNLFETDCKRAAVTLEEITEWASAQENEQLRLTMNQFLSNQFTCEISNLRLTADPFYVVVVLPKATARGRVEIPAPI